MSVYGLKLGNYQSSLVRLKDGKRETMKWYSGFGSSSGSFPTAIFYTESGVQIGTQAQLAGRHGDANFIENLCEKDGAGFLIPSRKKKISREAAQRDFVERIVTDIREKDSEKSILFVSFYTETVWGQDETLDEILDETFKELLSLSSGEGVKVSIMRDVNAILKGSADLESEEVEEGEYLILDWGHRALRFWEISIVQDEVRVKKLYSNERLVHPEYSMRQMEQKLIDWMKEKIHKETNRDCETWTAKEQSEQNPKLQRAAEELIRSLKDKVTTTDLLLEDLPAGDCLDLEVEKTELEKVIRDTGVIKALENEILQYRKKLGKTANFHVVLTGGGFCMPFAREALQARFADVKFWGMNHPTELEAYGAVKEAGNVTDPLASSALRLMEGAKKRVGIAVKGRLRDFLDAEGSGSMAEETPMIPFQAKGEIVLDFYEGWKGQKIENCLLLGSKKVHAKPEGEICYLKLCRMSGGEITWTVKQKSR